MMAASAITMEPQGQHQSSVSVTEGRCNENGEQIIIEAECHKSSVYCDAIFKIFLLSIISLLGILILIPLAFFLTCAAMKNWRLYLTQKAIHYHALSLDCLGGRSWVIPLSYIKEIHAIPVQKQIWLKMEISKVRKFIFVGKACCCFKDPEHAHLILQYVKNSEEFVQAVKGELPAQVNS